MHKLLPPYFLFANSTGALQGEVLSLINLLSKYACSCSFNIANNVGAIQYGALEMGVVPGIMLMANSIARLGGSLDISSNTSGNSSPLVSP